MSIYGEQEQATLPLQKWEKNWIDSKILYRHYLTPTACYRHLSSQTRHPHSRTRPHQITSYHILLHHITEDMGESATKSNTLHIMCPEWGGCTPANNRKASARYLCQLDRGVYHRTGGRKRRHGARTIKVALWDTQGVRISESLRTTYSSGNKNKQWNRLNANGEIEIFV